MILFPGVRRAQLASTTAGREGSALVGTDTKPNLGNADNAEEAFTWLDSWVVTTNDAIDAINDSIVDLEADIAALEAGLGTAADLFGWNEWRLPPGDPFEIRSNYGLTVRRDGDVYFVDDLRDLSGIFTISGGQGITVEVDGSDYTIHQRESRVVLTDGATVTLNCENDNNFRLNMSASPTDRTLALSNISVGQKFSILLKYAGANTVTWWSGIIWPGGGEPVLTSAASKGDMFAFECIAAGVYLGFTVNQDFDLTGV